MKIREQKYQEVIFLYLFLLVKINMDVHVHKKNYKEVQGNVRVILVF